MVTNTHFWLALTYELRSSRRPVEQLFGEVSRASVSTLVHAASTLIYPSHMLKRDMPAPKQANVINYQHKSHILAMIGHWKHFSTGAINTRRALPRFGLRIVIDWMDRNFMVSPKLVIYPLIEYSAGPISPQRQQYGLHCGQCGLCAHRIQYP